ncbi:chromosome partitioning protein, ParB family [Desulfuromusa kysingii]|uniref:Chromosome partitioning protein, ParB family n=1 Tax=Desulfuromusa kysingii TaxID=37625 RepID=A0A1H4AKS3_9BACT|nr:ParB/RepB/Spo0J family partition protein [Desulfuromusa kysingii]SEA36371.1 chromosome partitioning protein, ParB family [Desulfuromusa kysingii]
MSKVKRPALGKGIGALLSSAAQEGGKKYFSCPLEELKPHAQQPRKNFDESKMSELVASIKEKGVIQPLVVRRQDDYYQIIAGERRWRAAQKAGLERVPVVIQDVSEDWALEIALIENIQREDLNPLEEAEAYRYLMDSFDLMQEEVAKRVGKDRSTVANSLRLLRLPEKVKVDVASSRLSMGHARALLALEQDEDMIEASLEIIRKKLSVRETEKLVKKIKSTLGTRIAKSSIVKEDDPNLLALENSLRQQLGTQVKLYAKSKGGKIEISYHDQSELSRILELILG